MNKKFVFLWPSQKQFANFGPKNNLKHFLFRFFWRLFFEVIIRHLKIKYKIFIFMVSVKKWKLCAGRARTNSPIFWNWNHNNISALQNSARFRKSQKVLNHSCLFMGTNAKNPFFNQYPSEGWVGIGWRKNVLSLLTMSCRFLGDI